jgi:glycerophosphoryl diester phosphodiesterase
MSLLKNVRNLLGMAVAIEIANYAIYRAMRGPRPEHVQIVAHRGGAALATENTEEAFRNAARIGADWIEFDVHRTVDDVLVIMHDDTVNRMTNGIGYIKDMTWPQLHELRVNNGEFIMKFEEVVALAKETGIGILPELKSMSYYPDMEVEALEIVRKAGYVDRTIFLSFDWDALVHLKELEPTIRVAALMGMGQWDVSKVEPASAEIIAPMAEMLLVNPWLIPQAQAAGHEIWTWFGVLDNPLVYRLMLDLGVNGLIANDPVKALELVGRSSQAEASSALPAKGTGS